MDENKIIETYKSNKSLTKTADILGIGRHKVTNIIKKHGIEIVNYQNLPRVNEDYFENIDTEQKAYWLGFIYADGCISRGKIEIGLSIKDYDHLVKFKNDVGYMGDIKFRQSTNSCRIMFGSTKMINDLRKYGVHERKSTTKQFPNNIPSEFLKDFARGYFDGNGCIIKRNLKNGKTKYSLGISCGSKDFLYDFLNAINFDNRSVKKDKRTENYSCEWSLKHKEYLNYLYKDSNIYLDRKYSLYEKAINMPS